MQKRAVLISGVPGTGKTTLMKAIIEKFGGLYNSFEPVEFVKLVSSLHHKEHHLHVIGKYDDSDDIFQGTDKLSMAVMPQFKQFVESHQPNLLIEGDRLVGSATIDFLIENGYDLNLIILKAPQETLLERYTQRGSNQDEKFLKAKKTKVSNLETRLDLMMEGIISTVDHKTPEDTEKLSEVVYKYFKD